MIGWEARDEAETEALTPKQTGAWLDWGGGDEAETEALTPEQTGAWVDWEGEGGGGFGLVGRGRGMGICGRGRRMDGGLEGEG